MCKVSDVRRSLPALLLRRSPLAYVLAQVRISPVLLMEEYVPPIQESLRRGGYPRYAVARLQEFSVGPSQAVPDVKTSDRWLFQNQDRTEAVVVSDSFVALETSNYTTFDDFVQKLRTAIGIVGEAADIALSERIGLRYLDVIRPLSKSDQVDDYLAPGVRGIDPVAFHAASKQGRYDLQSTTVFGELRFRCTKRHGETPLPPDLTPFELESPLLGNDDTDVALLDFDHFSASSKPFDPDGLVDGFWDLHDAVDLAFRSSVTDHARDMWGATSI